MMATPGDTLSVPREDSKSLLAIDGTVSRSKLTDRLGICRWGLPKSLGKCFRSKGLRDTKQAQIIEISISAILKNVSAYSRFQNEINSPP